MIACIDFRPVKLPTHILFDNQSPPVIDFFNILPGECFFPFTLDTRVFLRADLTGRCLIKHFVASFHSGALKDTGDVSFL